MTCLELYLVFNIEIENSCSRFFPLQDFIYSLDVLSFCLVDHIIFCTHFSLAMDTFYDRVTRSNIYVQPVLFTLIIVTNALTIRVLSSRTLRISPCSHYLIGYATSAIIHSCFLCTALVIRALLGGWENSPIGCKPYYFTLFAPSLLARAMLVAAAFDRYCSSSKSRRLNSTSTQKAARRNIIIMTIAASVYTLPMVIIYNFDTTTNTCRQYTTILPTIYVFSQLMAYSVLPTLLLMIFAVLIVRNIREHNRILATARNS